MKRTASAFFILCVLLLLGGHVVRPQQPPQPQPPADPLGEQFFPPELVMQYQQAIGLSEEQKSSIKAEIQKAQARFTELQWQLQSEVETMLALAKEPRVNEQQALAQLDRILPLEREIKRTQIALVVRIKNSLTPEQQARLRELRNRPRAQE